MVVTTAVGGGANSTSIGRSLTPALISSVRSTGGHGGASNRNWCAPGSSSSAAPVNLSATCTPSTVTRTSVRSKPRARAVTTTDGRLRAHLIQPVDAVGTDQPRTGSA